MARPTSEASPPAQVFYRYVDENGRLVIVDSLSRVPPRHRASAERVALEAEATGAENRVTQGVHWESFFSGFACALVAVLLLYVVTRASKPLTRVLVVAALAALGGALYFGWLRRETGQSEDVVASPSKLIEDTRRALEKMKARNAEQERVLKEVERESR